MILDSIQIKNLVSSIMNPLVYDHYLRLLNIRTVESDISKEITVYCLDDIKDNKKLTKGYGGNVYIAVVNGKNVIIKITHDFNTDIAEDIINEVRGNIIANALLNNNAIPACAYTYSMGWCNKNDTMMYIQELIPGITLAEHLKNNIGTLTIVKSVVPQIAAFTLALTVNFKYKHNDLHAGNIMITKVEENTTIQYTLYGTKYSIPTYGLLVRVIDYGRSGKDHGKGGSDFVAFLNDLMDYAVYSWMDDAKSEFDKVKNESPLFILARYNNKMNSGDLSFKLDMNKSRINSTLKLCDEYEKKITVNIDDKFERMKESKRQTTIALTKILNELSDRTLEYVLSIPKTYIPLYMEFNDYDIRQSLVYAITMELKRRGVRDINPYKHLLGEPDDQGYYYMDIPLLQQRLLQ